MSVEELSLQLCLKSEEIKKKDELIHVLEKEIDEKDALIRHLKNEIDMFQQVVRPLTREIVTRKICTVEEAEEPRKLADHRPKRQAISAEPILNGAGEFPIVKIPKSSEVHPPKIIKNLKKFEEKISGCLASQAS